MEFLQVITGTLIGAGGVIWGIAYQSRKNLQYLREEGRRNLDHARAESQLRQRAETYQRLAELVVRLRAATTAASPDNMDNLVNLASNLGDRWWSLQASVAVHGSPEVQNQFDQLLVLRIRTGTALSQWKEILDQDPALRGPDDIQALETFRARRQETLELCESILKLANAELSPNTSE